MAQKATVVLEDDLEGDPADETVRFGFGGAEYEIDLSKKNAAAFRKKLTRSMNTPAHQGKDQPTGRRVPRQAVSAAPMSGPGRRPRASWSASAGAFPPAWWSNTMPPSNVPDG